MSTLLNSAEWAFVGFLLLVGLLAVPLFPHRKKGDDDCAEGLGIRVFTQPGPKGDSDAIALCHGRASGLCLR